ncbi:MAG: TonB-dependent receptor [Desulfococcus multivorans]|jgi:iron complex outermembrane receptor protein|nr:TonB-dependent receptor [Desulfococcus multivorans]
MIGNHLKRHRHLILGILCLASAGHWPGIAAAQDPAAILDTMTVTAERFPVREKESPRFVTVVSAEKLIETGANTLSDALRRVGGFQYKAFAPLGISHGGMNSTLSIRGIKDGELVLINGSPIQGAAGHAYDIDTIPLDQIERVEILKGAASTLYGADAMSGVINIITKQTGDTTSLGGTVEFGNESYHNHGAAISLPRVNLGFNYQHLGDQQEISRSFSQKYRYDLDDTDKYAWTVNARMFENLHFDYVGSYYRTGFEKRYDGNKKPFEGTDQDYYKNFANLRFETPTLKVKAFGTYDEMQRREYTAPDDPPNDPKDRNRNYNFGAAGDYGFYLSDWEFNPGAEWIYRGADYSNQYGSQYRNDYALFLQVKKTFLERLIAVVGVREQFIDGAAGARDYDKFLPSFGLTYTAADSLNLFANAGKAFRAPAFNDLYYDSDFLKGNPNLRPEEGWTYEAGVKYDDNFLQLRLSAFYMAYEDKIELDRSGGYPLTYFNAGDYESTGIEWNIGVNPFVHQAGWAQDLSLYTAGYWADPTAEDTDGKDYRTGPRFQASLGVDYLTEPVTLDLNCQLLTSRERELDDTVVLNFFSRVKLWKGHLTFAVDNIFDEAVQVSGDLSEDASNRYVYYDIGRLVKVGYEIVF